MKTSNENSSNEMQDYLLKICQAIADKKGINIMVLDVRGVCTMTDYFIIAEGTVDRHVKALAYSVEEALSQAPYRSEGLENGDWIVLDYVDSIVELFVPEMREKYQLETLWKEGKIVSLPIRY
jgi:ribosome-associated protein